jgi:uncharacterized membrane protein
MWPNMGRMAGWMVLWWAVGIVFLIFVGAVRGGLAWWLVPRGDETPEKLLKRRYAKGDIEREKYQRHLEDLRR